MILTPDYQLILASSRMGERVTDYSDRDWEEDERGVDEENPYFGIGHGDFSEELGFEPSYIVWAMIGGQIQVSKLTDPEEQSLSHGWLWGHDITDYNYKGRYEPETGRLTIVKPERFRHREIPNVLWTALRAKFKNIDEVRVF